jgi:hypothetical protein
MEAEEGKVAPPEQTVENPMALPGMAIENIEAVEPSEIEFFKSSEFAQPSEVTEFFKTQLKNPFNKYCIDCKKKKTTHALVWLGIYVCE